MIATSQEWKNLLTTEDILPESNVNIVSDNNVYDMSAFNISTTDKAFFSNIDFMSKTQRIINREQRKIATLEWNIWVLDGSYEIPTEETIIDRFVSDEISDVDGKFANPIKIDLVPRSSIMENPTLYTLEFNNGFATEIETPQSKSNKQHIITEYTNKYIYLETDYETSIDASFVKINSWSMPFRRARISELLLGGRIFFDKSNLSKFRHQRTGDMVNASLPQNDCNFTVLDLNADYDIYNSNAKFANIISTNSLFDVYYGYKIDGIWEYVKVDQMYLASLNRPQNGIEAKFVLESSLNRTTQTFKSSENITFTTYGELIKIISNKIIGNISVDVKATSFLNNPKESLSRTIIVALYGDFYNIPLNEMLQMVSSLINAFILRTPNGNYNLISYFDRLSNTPISAPNIVDTINLNNCFKYPEIEQISDIGNLTLSLIKYPQNRDEDTMDQEWSENIGETTITYPPQRFTQNYGAGVDETAEIELLVLGQDTTEGSVQNYTVNDGIHTAYMDWLYAFISGAKRVSVNMRINPAWQIGDLISVQLKDKSYIKGFIVDIDIEFASYSKGNVTILAPKNINS